MSSFVPFSPESAGVFSAFLLPPPAEPVPTPGGEDTPGEEAAPRGPSEAEINALISAAEERGAAAARAQMAEQQEQLQMRHRELGSLIEQVEMVRKSDCTETRQLVGSLVIASMRRLIGEHPILREAALRHAFAQAVSGMVGDRDVVLWVAPGQETIARELIEERQGWSVRVNSDLRAGLQVVSPRGRLDSSLTTALIAMEAAVNAWLEERS